MAGGKLKTAYTAPKALAKIVASDHKKVAKLAKESKQETNILDTLVASVVSTTAVITPLTLVPQGDDLGTRTGDKITLTGLKIRGAIEVPSATSVPPCVVRVMYVRWKDGRTGSLPTIGTLLSGSTNVLSDFNYVYRSSFDVLYDKMFNVSAVEGKAFSINKFIKLKEKPATFYSTGSGAYDKGHIFQVLISDQATFLPNFTSYNRLYYKS